MSSSLGMIGDYGSSEEEELIEEEQGNNTHKSIDHVNIESKSAASSSSMVLEQTEPASSFDDLFNSFYSNSGSSSASKETGNIDRSASRAGEILGAKRKFDERSSYPMKPASKLSFKPPQLSKPNINTEDTKAWVSSKS
jgi:hypothetical protein